MFIDENHILHVIMQKEVHIEDAMDNFIAIRRFTGISSAKLIDLRGVIKLDKKAELFLYTRETQNKTKATAFLIKNKFKKWIDNFYSNFSSDKIPVKTFTDYNQAIVWLKTFNL